MLIFLFFYYINVYFPWKQVTVLINCSLYQFNFCLPVIISTSLFLGCGNCEAFTQTLVNEQWIHAHALGMFSIWSVGPFRRLTQASIEGVWSMWNRSDRDVGDVSCSSEFHSSRWTDDNETNLSDNNRNAVVMATASKDPKALFCYFTRATRVELISSSLVLFIWWNSSLHSVHLLIMCIFISAAVFRSVTTTKNIFLKL